MVKNMLFLNLISSFFLGLFTRNYSQNTASNGTKYRFERFRYFWGKDHFSEVDIRIRVKEGGRIAQIYAFRQALSKALVAYIKNLWINRARKPTRQNYFGR